MDSSIEQLNKVSREEVKALSLIKSKVKLDTEEAELLNSLEIIAEKQREISSAS